MHLDPVIAPIGVAAILAAVVSGGFEAADLKFPVLNSIARQLLLAMVGILLLVASSRVRLVGNAEDATKEQGDAAVSIEDLLLIKQHFARSVRAFWVDGFLGAAAAPLNLRPELAWGPELVANPWADLGRPPLPRRADEVTDLESALEAADGRLLLAGGAGSGKTTLLCRLAGSLLLAFEAAPERAPVPLFLSLGFWRSNRGGFEGWVDKETRVRYGGVSPQKLFRDGATASVLLLDGLDELGTDDREECIEAINAFLARHPRQQIVVVSRADDYLECAARLSVNAAVTVKPLSSRQVLAALKDAKLAGARAAIRDDPALGEVLDSPLWLSVVAKVFGGYTTTRVRALGSIDVRRRAVMDEYVRELLDRPQLRRFPSNEVQRWLRFIGDHLASSGQTIFHLQALGWALPGRLRFLGPLPLLLGVSLGALFGSGTLAVAGTVLWGGGVTGGVLGMWVGLGIAAASYAPTTVMRLNLTRGIRGALYGTAGFGIGSLLIKAAFPEAWGQAHYEQPGWGGVATDALLGAVSGGALLALGALDLSRSEDLMPHATFGRRVRESLRSGLIAATVVAGGVYAIGSLRGSHALPPAMLGFVVAFFYAGGAPYVRIQINRAALAAAGLIPWKLNAFVSDLPDGVLVRHAGDGLIIHALLRDRLAEPEREPGAADDR